MDERSRSDGQSAAEAALLVAAAIAAWFYLSHIDAFQALVRHIEANGSSGLDKAVVAIPCFGIAAVIHAMRGQARARRELRRAIAAEQAWLAAHDPLTRLGNRHSIEVCAEDIDKGLARGERRLVCAIDLDGFKRVNDLMGHAAGDDLLRVVAARLESVSGCALVARLGADEFVLISDADAADNPPGFVDAIQSRIGEPIRTASGETRIGVWIGMAICPDDAAGIIKGVQAADIAMSAAKKSGRNGVRRFDRSMHDLLQHRALLERDLEAAIRAEAIRPHYQPLVDLRSGRLRGFEALARWNRPGHGQVPPIEFIAVAEEAGLMSDLFESLLRQACRDARTWPGDLTLAFNLSPTQLADRLIGLRIVAVLAEVGFLPSRLEIEITESALIRDMANAVAILEDLHQAGIRIALDDFGTGYSSLAHLSQLKFDRIKIDKSFVDNFENDSRQRKIVQAVVALGNGLGIPTTAEGIETESQRATLEELGCFCGQGYLFGRAVTAEEALAIAAGERPSLPAGAAAEPTAAPVPVAGESPPERSVTAGGSPPLARSA